MERTLYEAEHEDLRSVASGEIWTAIGMTEPGGGCDLKALKTKWWSAQVQNEVLDACVQLHGGYGYMNEYRVARASRDARVTKIWAGSNEIMKELIGRELGQ